MAPQSADRLARRAFALVAAAVLACGCGSPAAGPLPSTELLTGGATRGETLPLVVALHGRGSDPRRFGAQAFHGFTARARVALLEAPIAETGGRAWFTFGFGLRGAREDALALVPRLEATVTALVAAHPPEGKPVVTGFSQGAMLIYPWLAAHPSTFGGAVPVSGAILPGLMPENFSGARFPPVRALHGSADEVISPDMAEDAIDTLDAAGADATLELVPGATHWIGGAMRTRFHAVLEERVLASGP